MLKAQGLGLVTARGGRCDPGRRRPSPPLDARKLLKLLEPSMLVTLLPALPYGLRVTLAGVFGRVVLGRLPSMGRRMTRAVRQHLPERSAREARRIAVEASGNMRGW